MERGGKERERKSGLEVGRRREIGKKNTGSSFPMRERDEQPRRRSVKMLEREMSTAGVGAKKVAREREKMDRAIASDGGYHYPMLVYELESVVNRRRSLRLSVVEEKMCWDRCITSWLK